MKFVIFTMMVILLLMLTGCGENFDSPVESDNTSEIDFRNIDLIHSPKIKNLIIQESFFHAFLTGFEEVPDPVITDARGLALFRFNASGTGLDYTLIVQKIENVTMAHIHLAPAGENGPVVLWLYPEDGPPPQEIPGEFNGVLAVNTVTSEDLVGPLAGMTLQDLFEEMLAGNAYVNVHTTQNPGGEIRGQINRPPVIPTDFEPTYEIKFENLTTGNSQPFSPPVLATHMPNFHIFQEGELASDELRQLAEDAVNQPLVDLLNQSPFVLEVIEGSDVILPGASATFHVQTKIPFIKLSLVTMLVNTNDAFTGVDGIRLPLFGKIVLELNAFDAGTEMNTELKEHIPGPCCGNPGVRVPTTEPIALHPGILGVGDLSRNVYGWQEPVARLTITRISPLGD